MRALHCLRLSLLLGNHHHATELGGILAPKYRGLLVFLGGFPSWFPLLRDGRDIACVLGWLIGYPAAVVRDLACA